MKKQLLLAILLSMVNFIFAQEALLCGDVNNDKNVDIVDALMVAHYYTIQDLSINAEAADVNADMDINIIDSLLIAQFYVGLINKLVCQENQVIDIIGEWNLSSKVTLSLIEDEYIYDFDSSQWISEVEIYYRDVQNIKLTLPTRREYSNAYTMKMNSQEEIFPYYEISIEYDIGVAGYYLKNAVLRIMEDEAVYTDFTFEVDPSRDYYEVICYDKSKFDFPELVLKNSDGSQKRYLKVSSTLDHTHLLEANITHILSYKYYDAVMKLRFIDNTSWSAWVLDQDMIIGIKGTYKRKGTSLTLAVPEIDRPYVEPPIILEIVTNDDGSIYLYRRVQNEPSLSAIASYFGISSSNIASYTYAQRFEKR